MAVVHIPGKKAGKVMLYALSTCGWCAKTKKLLDDLGVEYAYEYVDHLIGNDRDAVVKELTRWNPAGSFPTLIINEEKCIVGFKEDEIREVLAK